ncbi:MAG: tRNA (adenosine(37)-N6)-dimethylallyltransferase MiaA [Bacteroidetes bacterium]|uniref:tRNA dimethylallyltransferase n=1 Tax=Candidatus Egerieousia excrementavium TaxID=2840778 RepID=A0A9D9DMM1_9BACT|nr:tRNA (adenosine(37)-N6)-dimethylallyltransferase MiaA [Candidatus Egerieousia excrementavium]
MYKPLLLIILGPTAVGKTDFAIERALECGSPVVSCDSRQIYKELKIGTAPPSSEQLARVRHYFIFSHSVNDYFTAGRYEIEALALLDELFKTHSTVVMAGGSGLYIDALCNGLDDFPPADQNLRRRLTLKAEKEGVESLAALLREIDPLSYETIEISNRQRVIRAVEVTLQTGRKFSDWKSHAVKERPFQIRKIFLSRDRELLYERINKRVDLMMEQGLLDEALSLMRFRDRPALNTVGYKELFDYIDGKTSLAEAVELIKRNSRRYAKKQLTYWRRDNALETVCI